MLLATGRSPRRCFFAATSDPAEFHWLAGITLAGWPHALSKYQRISLIITINPSRAPSRVLARNSISRACTQWMAFALSPERGVIRRPGNAPTGGGQGGGGIKA